MRVSRRQLLLSSSLAVLPSALPGAVRADELVAAGRRDRWPKKRVVPAPDWLWEDFVELVHWLMDKGWTDYLDRYAGFSLPALLSGDDALFRDIDQPLLGPFEGCAGTRPIQPGEPAMSLLYHALASASVRPVDHEGRTLPASAFPALGQIDLLENYIYARATLPADQESLVPAVFAYEYRPAHKTPHGKHADLVFARTGIARTGTSEARYDAFARTYRSDAGQGAAVLPARYGLFLARRIAKGRVSRIGRNALDRRLDFLLPVTKLFEGSLHLEGQKLTFAESHRDEKLRRLAHATTSAAGTDFNWSKPPFLRRSSSRADRFNSSTLPGHDTGLVSLTALPGSALVSPIPGPLVALARQGEEICRFTVPTATEGVTSNRRYTTLKLSQTPRRNAADFILSDLIFRGGRYTTGLRSPRNAPVFANIRHEVCADGQVRHIGSTRAELLKVARGGYQAAMFTDGLCDGCVVAVLEPGFASSSRGPAWRRRSPLPAFSIVAAPDFFPHFDPIDLDPLDRFFFEGGTETLSGGRLPANPAVPWPGSTKRTAFPVDLGDSITRTITAVVAAPPALAAAPATSRRGEAVGTNTLPDTVSNIFAPGWDITYSGREGSDPVYLATFGLGSPFPEDMKLCAAANGMWAGSSPDATRTFYPDLEPFPLLGRPATAVPLTDEELGFHPQSPACAEHAVPVSSGWDGEYGPFLRIGVDNVGHLEMGANYADMLLSDYVRNATDGRIDLGRMHSLSQREVLERMNALERCIRRLPGHDRVRSTKLWLVSAERVGDWSAGAAGLGVPSILRAHARDRIPAAAGVAGEGWLYAFAKTRGPSSPMGESRRFQPCSALYICQVSAAAIRVAEFQAGKAITDLSWQ